MLTKIGELMAKTDRSKRIIEVADYLYGNPDKDRGSVLAKFGEIWRISSRSFDRIIKDAKEYNLNRVQKEEEIRSSQLEKNAQETISQVIVDRSKVITILSEIAQGNKAPDSNRSPSYKDRISAIQQLSKMQGWDAPVETKNTTTTIIIGDR